MKRSTTALEWRRIYYVLQSARQRCTNPKVPNYASYGGRGITFHEPWAGQYGPARFAGVIAGDPAGLAGECLDPRRREE